MIIEDKLSPTIGDKVDESDESNLIVSVTISDDGRYRLYIPNNEEYKKDNTDGQVC